MSTIMYKNSVISEFATGQTVTLNCNGKIMQSDIVIMLDCPAIMLYGAISRDIDSGKTVTVPCASKKMSSDIIITAIGFESVTKLEQTAVSVLEDTYVKEVEG